MLEWAAWLSWLLGIKLVLDLVVIELIGGGEMLPGIIIQTVLTKVLKGSIKLAENWTL